MRVGDLARVSCPALDPVLKSSGQARKAGSLKLLTVNRCLQKLSSLKDEMMFYEHHIWVKKI